MDKELQIREQIRIGTHAAAIQDDFTAYIDSIKEGVINDLSHVDIAQNKLTELHVMFVLCEKLRKRLNADILAGKIAEKELTRNDV